MLEFKVNKFITLKLEEDETIIYVSGEPFRQCKHIFIYIPIDQLPRTEEIRSVDEVSESFDVSLETSSHVPSEARFWAHSSNLQAWAENNYNTNLLHSNLAFPLLKKLTDIGDRKAKLVFKKEIAQRIENGYLPTIRYLWNERYVKYLSLEEFTSILPSEYIELKQLFCIEDNIKRKLYWAEDDSDSEGEQLWFIMEDGRVSKLEISYIPDLNFIPCPILKLTCLKSLRMMENALIFIPNQIGSLKCLKYLDLSVNKIRKIPDGLINCNKLERIILSLNRINYIPESLGKLNNLQSLDLHSNNISSIPSSIGDLATIESINLSYNKISSLPESIGNLSSLKILNLSCCNLKKIPDFIVTLHSLEHLLINGNKLDCAPENLKLGKKILYLQLDYKQVFQIENILKDLEDKGVKILKKK